MLNLIDKNKIVVTILFCLGSFLAGGINGFVGTGGGILFVILLSYLTKNDKRDSFAITLCATVPISIVGLFAYYRAGAIDFQALPYISIPTVLGGLLGALLVDKLKVKWLNGLFAVLIIYSGINLILR
ncbi:MAG: sulfite exporter TauE/SafE family protein [Clostridia bacterium]|nr:sulfite exporter TauE/SafE family protein [Clostridia bacterium]